MVESGVGIHRQQHLYWNKMVELKVYALYARLYRDRLGRLVTAMGTVRAVASSASIAAWAIWRDYAFVWAAIIALSQVLDALQDVFPVTKRYKAVSEHAVTLDSLFIDTQLEWDGVSSGVYSNTQINNRLHKLRKLHHEAESQSFHQEGLPTNAELFKEAQSQAEAFFSLNYGVELTARGENNENEI